MSGQFVAYGGHENDMNKAAFFDQYIIYSKIRRGLPCGMDSMGHVILSFHKRKRSETIGCKKH